MTPVDKIVAVVGLVTSLAAAGFWLWASLIEVPNKKAKTKWLAKIRLKSPTWLSERFCNV